MIIGGAVAVAWADPVATAVARIAAPRRIVVPLAPVCLLAATGAATEAAQAGKQPAAARTIPATATAAARRFAALVAATGRLTAVAATTRRLTAPAAPAARFAATGRSGAAAHRRWALAATIVRRAGETASVGAVAAAAATRLAAARSLAAATRFTATAARFTATAAAASVAATITAETEAFADVEAIAGCGPGGKRKHDKQRNGFQAGSHISPQFDVQPVTSSR